MSTSDFSRSMKLSCSYLLVPEAPKEQNEQSLKKRIGKKCISLIFYCSAK